MKVFSWRQPNKAIISLPSEDQFAKPLHPHPEFDFFLPFSFLSTRTTQAPFPPHPPTSGELYTGGSGGAWGLILGGEGAAERRRGDGAAAADLRVRGAGHGGAGRVHRVHRQLHHHRRPVPAEAPRQQQQVHIQLRRPHLQLPRRGRIQWVASPPPPSPVRRSLRSVPSRPYLRRRGLESGLGSLRSRGARLDPPGSGGVRFGRLEVLLGGG